MLVWSEVSNADIFRSHFQRVICLAFYLCLLCVECWRRQRGPRAIHEWRGLSPSVFVRGISELFKYHTTFR